jgi:hypothetical protein
MGDSYLKTSREPARSVSSWVGERLSSARDPYVGFRERVPSIPAALLRTHALSVTTARQPARSDRLKGVGTDQESAGCLPAHPDQRRTAGAHGQRLDRGVYLRTADVDAPTGESLEVSAGRG